MFTIKVLGVISYGLLYIGIFVLGLLLTDPAEIRYFFCGTSEEKDSERISGVSSKIQIIGYCLIFFVVFSIISMLLIGPAFF